MDACAAATAGARASAAPKHPPSALLYALLCLRIEPGRYTMTGPERKRAAGRRAGRGGAPRGLRRAIARADAGPCPGAALRRAFPRSRSCVDVLDERVAVWFVARPSS